MNRTTYREKKFIRGLQFQRLRVQQHHDGGTTLAQELRAYILIHKHKAEKANWK